MAEHIFEIKKGKKATVVDFINTKFIKTRESMQEVYRSWMLNLAWVRGFQNVDYSLKDRKFRSYNQKNPWRVRLISNLMLPVARRMVSNLVTLGNVWDVIPATSDEDDIQIAETGSKVLQDTWQRKEMDQKTIRLAFWQSICSSAFLKVGWDANIGNFESVPANNIDEDLARQFMEFNGFDILPDEIEVNEGDVFIDVVSPFNIIFDENANVIEDSPWSIETSLRTKDWVIENFGTKFKDLTESKEHELFLYPFITGQKTRAPRTGVLIHELFIKRNNKFKKGLHAVIAGDQIIIRPQDNPYEHGELPYAHFLEIYDPASLYGTCSVEQIRSNQARYNRISSGIMEQINLMSNLQWLNPRQSGIKQFTNRPGQVLSYTFPHKPEQVQLRPIPAYVERLLDRTRLDMQDTASTHDVSEAKAEPGVRSGRAVLALQDADDSILGPTLLWFDRALSKTGRLVLQTLTQFVDSDRIIQIRGEFNEQQAITFSGETLKGNSKGADYWKVRVKTYGRQAMSRGGRETLTRTLIELQLLNPQVHREELLQIIGAADILSIYDKSSADRTRQWKEIQKIINGEDVSVYLGQNHDAHIRAIKRYISSGKWDGLDDKQKQGIVQHMSQHMQQEVLELTFPQLFAASLSGDSRSNGRPAPGQERGNQRRGNQRGNQRINA